jgi:uncharacterized protein (DUF58 family)
VTPRGKLVLAVGVLAYVGAWLFGATSVYPAAAGLVLGPLAARAWVRAAAGPIRLARRPGRGSLVEGEDVWIRLEAQPQSRVPPPALRVRERLARLGDQEVPLRRDRRAHRGTYVLERVPRGRYVVEEAVATLEDPFGLASAEVALDTGAAIVVYPRLVELDALFSESGAHAQDGRRMLLRRPSGFDLHSVREYERGESLRKVHWATTARRGQLMVKDLEDAPRDEIAVVLDGDATGVTGASFDVQVRAAGSVLRTHAARGRRAVLSLNAARPASVRVSSLEGDWEAALATLAAAEPDAPRPVLELIGREGGAAARALELVVVTASLTPALATKLLQRAHGAHGVSVVWIDAPSFAGRPTKAQPELLRLQHAGIPVAAVRAGDDLRRALGGAAVARRAASG